jgi:hypothetical protein
MSNTILSWRNWCFELGTVTALSGTFEADAPLANLLTPQPGEMAISTTNATQIQIRCDWGESSSPPLGLPLGMIAILAHNMAAIPISAVPPNVFYQIGIQLTDANGATYTVNNINRADTLIQTSTDFQSNLYWLPPKAAGGAVDLSKITAIRITLPAGNYYGKLDPYTGILAQETFRAGCLWAGPIWRPDHTFRTATFRHGVIETPRGGESIGKQKYPLPQPRQRTMSAEFAKLSSAESFRLATTGPGLQQMAAWCARSRPLICIPDASSAEKAYTQGIYGYLDSAPMIDHHEVEGTDSIYTSSISMTEAL